MSSGGEIGAVKSDSLFAVVVDSLIRPMRESVALMVVAAQRRLAALAVFFGLLVVAFDMLTIVGLYPILVFVAEGKEALFSKIPSFATLDSLLAAVGLSVSLPFLCLFSSLMIVLRSVARYLQTAYANRLSLSVVLEKRDQFFERFIREPVAYSALQNKNDRISFLVNDCNRVGDLARAGSEAIVDMVFIVVYVTALSVIYVEAVLLSLLAGGIIFASLHRRTRRGRELGEQLSSQSLKSFRLIDESMANVKLVKLRGMEASIVKSVRKSLSVVSDLYDRLVAEKALIENVSTAILHVAILAIFVTIVFRFDGDIALIGVFSVLAMRAVPHVSRLNSLRFEFGQSLQALDRVRLTEETMAPSEVFADDDANGDGHIGSIGLEDVTFEYPSVPTAAISEKPPVLEGRRGAVRDVSLSIGHGELVAVIGASGAGKSTLADLVASLIEPTEGALRVDGRPLSPTHRRSYRRRLGIVSQHVAFFDLSLRENLTFGLTRDVPDEEIQDALGRASCSSFVGRLPNGLDTRMGIGGGYFSGGQRQRLALARELLNRPDVLILDEPTSALDAESERAILASLTALKGQITIVVIAHRLSTVAIGDRVLLMEDGELVREYSKEEMQNATEARNLLSV